MSDVGRGDGVLQRAIEMVELGDDDVSKLLGAAGSAVEPLERARSECVEALERNPRHRDRLMAVLELLDAAITLAQRRA